MAHTPTQEHLIKKNIFFVEENQIVKEDSTVIKYQKLMAVVPKHKHLIKKIFFFVEAKQIAKRRI